MHKMITLYYLYHFAFFLIALTIVRQFRKTTRADKNKHRFAIVVPAHNEENVIDDSVKSMMNCDYPKSLFDVFVIADNCTDRTAALAQSAGAKVLTRFNRTLRGKQHALKWAFEEIDLNNYDAVVVLDADNHVDPNYLRIMDAELSQGNKIIQGYVETKNPCESWITANYAYMFWYICRLQMSRTMAGLSGWLAGTGFCLSVDVLKRVGWNVTTMTDDVEYTCQLILAGEKVVFAPDAIIYDQKPVGLMDSARQRLRWIRGQTQVSFKYIPRLIITAVRSWAKGNIGQAARSIDAAMWVPMHLVICASVFLSIHQGWWQYLLSVFLTVPAFNFLPMVAERIKLYKPWAYLITAGAFFLSWIPITAYGVISCGNKAWWRTPH